MSLIGGGQGGESVCWGGVHLGECSAGKLCKRGGDIFCI